MTHRHPGGAGAEIRALGEADVAELIVCVRRCYGETYGEPGFYDDDWLVAQLRSMRLLSVGACDGGRVVAHVGTTVTSPGDAVGDTVAAMVEPAHRGLGLVHQMGRSLFAMFQERGIVATRHLATGAHLRTQRPLAESGAIPTGVLLGHVPAGTEYRGLAHRFGHHRIGVVVYFQRYGDLVDVDVHLPVRYASVLADLYERAGLDRHDRRPNPVAVPLPPDEPTADITLQHNRRADVAAVRIAAAPDTRISTSELAGALEHRAEVTYVDVPLAHPDCPAAVEWLRGRGFIFGALLPGTVDSECVRMQHVRATHVDPVAIECATTEGTRLRDWIASELVLSSARRSR